ncbi:MAG: pilus assembly protein [Myxococcaceae bacterium]
MGHHTYNPPTTRESGQAAVEAALTLPMVLFVILGTLQLFMLLHGRLLAEYAVYRAVRAGSLNHGDCAKMTDAAVLSVLPAIEKTDGPDQLATAFRRHRNNRYDNDGHTGQIIEIWREAPLDSDVPDPEDKLFDQPNRLMRLEARMVFWYRLKIPFADWVMERMFLAQWNLRPYGAQNPLMETQKAKWPDAPTTNLNQAHDPWPGGPLDQSLLGWEDQGHHLFPIEVNYSMRMMTPAKKKFWRGLQGCPL